MWDRATGDQAFINMMTDFVAKNAFKLATTEDFKAIAEKHMTPQMDLDKNGRLDWFFSQWVSWNPGPGLQIHPLDQGCGE